MSVTMTMTLNASDGGTNFLQSVSLTTDQLSKFSFTVTSAAVDQAEAVSFVLTKVKGLYLMADTTTTVYVNSTHGGSPANTLTLYPNIPVQYYTSGGYTLTALFAADVTTLYFSGAGTTTGNVSMMYAKSA